MSSKDFLGKGLKFPLQVDPRTGKIAMVSYEDDIREAVGIIIMTYRGERVMRPEFGSDVADYVFAPMSHSPAQSIAFELKRTLTLQEPRIENVEVTARDASATGTLDIHVDYTVRSTNNRYNLVYPFHLLEGSDV